MLNTKPDRLMKKYDNIKNQDKQGDMVRRIGVKYGKVQ